MDPTQHRILSVEFGGEVLATLSFEEALRSSKYQLVLLDRRTPLSAATGSFDLVVLMGLSPREDEGLAFLKDLNELFPNVPKLVVSAHTETYAGPMVKKMGAKFISRLSTKKEFLDKVEQTLKTPAL